MNETKFFKVYYKTIRATSLVILIAALLLSALQFIRGLEHEHTLIKKQFQQSNADLELIIEACVEHVRALKIRAEDYLNMPHLERTQPLFDYLSDNSTENYYHLDSLPIAPKNDFTGSLTGKGSLKDLSTAKKREINMALSLNHLFKATARNIPNMAWVYYTSEDFINIYPHVQSSQFRFTDELFYHDFYQNALPANNPRGELFWTTAYIDEAGKGLMVTCAAPIYEGSTFKGSVSLDLTLDSLNSIILHAQRDDGTLFIVNPSEQILAHPQVSAADTSITNLDKLLSNEIYQVVGDLSGWEPEIPHKVAGHYVYFENIPDTPWKMVFIDKVSNTYWRVFREIGAALLFLILSIAAVLYIANRTTEKQFIVPAQLLVEHIQHEDQNLTMVSDAKIPAAWQAWFQIVSNIFASNRDLVHQLEQQNEDLEEIVIDRTKELIEKNEELKASEEELMTMNEQLTDANEEITLTNRKLTDSINYARRIQKGIFPSLEQFAELFPESFCLFSPRDIVSGDFFWFTQVNQYKIVAVADCTGHGVPGAFMSMLGITLLEDVIKDRKIISPEKALDALRTRIINVFQKRGNNTPKDGLNISLCVIDEQKSEIQFAGAYHPLLLVRKQEKGVLLINNMGLEPSLSDDGYHLFQIKSDKQPIGHFIDEAKQFSRHTINYTKGDTIYMYSDGYPDQFGGPDNKKFMTRRFKRLIVDLQGKELQEQRKALKLTLSDWMGLHEQIDDICVMGIRLS
ncbi:MAG: SpoIIE family protein phosphatase [Flammeovirgaceae bacterium]